MKKDNTVTKGRKQIFKQARLTIGLVLGDRSSHYCILDEAGNIDLAFIPHRNSKENLSRNGTVRAKLIAGDSFRTVVQTRAMTQ